MGRSLFVGQLLNSIERGLWRGERKSPISQRGVHSKLSDFELGSLFLVKQRKFSVGSFRTFE